MNVHDSLVGAGILGAVVGSILLAVWLVKWAWRMVPQLQRELPNRNGAAAQAALRPESQRVKRIRLSLTVISVTITVCCICVGVAMLIALVFSSHDQGKARDGIGALGVFAGAYSIVIGLASAYLALLLYRRRYWEMANAGAVLTLLAVLMLASPSSGSGDPDSLADDAFKSVVFLLVRLVIYAVAWPFFLLLRRTYSRLLGISSPELQAKGLSNPMPDAEPVREDGLGRVECGALFGLFLIAPLGNIVVSSILYKQWRPRSPLKARQVNCLGWTSFGVHITLGIGLYYYYWVYLRRTMA